MHWFANRSAALLRLAEFAPLMGSLYANARNHDEGERSGAGRPNVSQLSPWLHAGLLDESEVIEAAIGQNDRETCDRFVAEVFWRVYFKGYLEQHPSIWSSYLRGRNAAMESLEQDAALREAYERAIEGRTGIEAFDLWARELVRTGYLHNHARMWFASIWIFTLRLDWQLGADWFLRHLIDGDAASNTLSWRWVGGLHTKGKTYLARSENIARFTERRSGGPLQAKGLAEEAAPLSEAHDHQRQPLDLPDALEKKDLAEPFALLLHDEAASHVPLALPCAPSAIIGAARPQARSPGTTADKVVQFARSAVFNGLEEAARAYECEGRLWENGNDLSDLLAELGCQTIVVPYLAQGWTRDVLIWELGPLIERQQAVQILPEIDRATWPHARAGFFRVKKQIPGILNGLGIGGHG